MIKIVKIFLVTLFCIQAAGGADNIFIKYDQLNESIELFKLFHDISDGYFVDVGGYNPLTISNTLYLYTKGWTGINIEASPYRFKKFVYNRKADLNLNIGIGQDLGFVSFYNAEGVEGRSTINPGVYETLKKQNRKIEELKVPLFNLAELCHRYYEKRPNYMNIDIEGYSTQALQGNDWSDVKCRPEIIEFQENHSFNSSGLKSPRQIVEELGYKLLHDLSEGEIWVDGDVSDKYFNKKKTGEKVLNETWSTYVEFFLDPLYRKFGYPGKGFNDQYDPINEPFYFFLPKENTHTHVKDINIESNLIGKVKDRPILIPNYISKKIVLIADKNRTQVSKFLAGDYLFTNITVKKEDGKKFEVWVLSQMFEVNLQFLAEQESSSPIDTVIYTSLLWILVLVTVIASYDRCRDNKQRIQHYEIEGRNMKSGNSLAQTY